MRGASTRGIAHRETVCTIQAAFTGGSAHGPGMGKSTATIDSVEALPRVSAAIADRRSHRGTLRKVRSDDALVRWKTLPIDTCPLRFHARVGGGDLGRRRRRLCPGESPRWGRIARRRRSVRRVGFAPRFGKNTPERWNEERMPWRSTTVPARKRTGCREARRESVRSIARRRWGIVARRKARGVRIAPRSIGSPSRRVSMVDAGCTYLWPVCVVVRASERRSQRRLGARDRFERVPGRTSGSHPDGKLVAHTA